MPKDKLKLPATDRGINAIGPAPKGERPIYWDALMPGLGLRVTDTGRKTFVVFRRVKGGKLVNHAIGLYPVVTLKEARDRAREVLLTLADGKTPKQVEAAEAESRGPTFAAVAEDYIRLHVRRNLKTAKDRREVEARIRDQLIARWGDRPIAEIRNRDVVRIVDAIIKAGGDDPNPGSRRKAGGPNAARHALSTARALFAIGDARSGMAVMLRVEPAEKDEAQRLVGSEPVIVCTHDEAMKFLAYWMAPMFAQKRRR